MIIFLIDTGQFRTKSCRDVLSIHVNILVLMSHFLKYMLFLFQMHVFIISEIPKVSLLTISQKVPKIILVESSFVPSLFVFSSISQIC